ncbi:hypothetical protein GCM10011579_065630 [Streptomyces albiflavescens]|uniref:Uncharacterized protein n=1 Tax=Streptomyces albiflavescens TaxID=1623582 RepID=A0A917YAD3_9ACTN|nr:hypothetical protein [Streptomyces albiflavescens]GGN80243.1 hypothetical protein GCM10011579_065630 [Streptomyces albiflavescens]
MTERSVIVYPPVKEGGRQVRIDGEIVGVACSLTNLAEMMRHAGWEGVDQLDVANSPVVEWHGGGPEVWTRRD